MCSDLSNLPTEVVEICVNCKIISTTRDQNFEKYLCLTHPYQVNRCLMCELRWLSPRPTKAGYEKLYSAKNYFTSEAGEHISYENLLSVRVAHFKKRIESLSKYFPGRKSLSILDYGAATGDFAATAINHGYICSGIEFSSDARRIAALKNKINLYSPEEFNGVDLLFDVIHMNHVLEHMPDPVGHLVWCKERMTNDGLLIIEVPQQFKNYIDLIKRLFGRGGRFRKFGPFSLHHTYFFSSRNLIEMVEKCGFKVMHVTTDVNGVRGTEEITLRIKLIRLFSWVANLLSRGGDNIEIYARKIK